jgi:hypothetical protein
MTLLRNLATLIRDALLVLLALWTLGAALGIVWLGWHMVTGG